MSEVRIAAEPRTEFGKGAARRIRRADKVPAVLYGHGEEPTHLSLPGHELMIALRTPNVLIRLDGLAKGSELALPKAVQRDPIKGFLKHVDLLLVKSGEKVSVEIPVVLSGEIVPGGIVDQQLIQVAVEAEATHIPESVEVSIEGLDIGDAVYAKDLKLPAGALLEADPEALVVHVTAPAAEEPEEAEVEEAEAAEGEAPAEGEAAAEESSEE